MAEFLAANQVLVGISLDGTKELHDNTRLDAKGKGTWNPCNRGIACFAKA